MRRLGIFWGLLFLSGGALSFVPGVVKDGLYLGIFRVNTAHNLLHLATGMMFLLASLLGARAARSWFQFFGVFYAAMAATGFWVGNGMICGLIPNNQYDSWGHAGLALIMLAIGFVVPRRIAGPQRIFKATPRT